MRTKYPPSTEKEPIPATYAGRKATDGRLALIRAGIIGDALFVHLLHTSLINVLSDTDPVYNALGQQPSHRTCTPYKQDSGGAHQAPRRKQLRIASRKDGAATLYGKFGLRRRIEYHRFTIHRTLVNYSSLSFSMIEKVLHYSIAALATPLFHRSGQKLSNCRRPPCNNLSRSGPLEGHVRRFRGYSDVAGSPLSDLHTPGIS